MPMLTPLGKTLRRHRLEKGELLKDMAEKLGVSPAFLSGVETGRKSPPPRLFELIASHYDIDREELALLQKKETEQRKEVTLRIPSNASQKHREAAFVLARRFDGLGADQIRKLLKLFEEG